MFSQFLVLLTDHIDTWCGIGILLRDKGWSPILIYPHDGEDHPPSLPLRLQLLVDKIRDPQGKAFPVCYISRSNLPVEGEELILSYLSGLMGQMPFLICSKPQQPSVQGRYILRGSLTSWHSLLADRSLISRDPLIHLHFRNCPPGHCLARPGPCPRCFSVSYQPWLRSFLPHRRIHQVSPTGQRSPNPRCQFKPKNPLQEAIYLPSGSTRHDMLNLSHISLLKRLKLNLDQQLSSSQLSTRWERDEIPFLFVPSI